MKRDKKHAKHVQVVITAWQTQQATFRTHVLRATIVLQELHIQITDHALTEPLMINMVDKTNLLAKIVLQDIIALAGAVINQPPHVRQVK